MAPNSSSETKLPLKQKVDPSPVANPPSKVDRILSYCYNGKLVYAQIANDYEKSIENALDAFKDLGIREVPKQNLNLYIFLGKNPGKKVYITKHYWSEVVALLKEKGVQVLYLEEKKRINDAEKTSWFKNVSWTTIFGSPVVQGAATLATDAIESKVNGDENNGDSQTDATPVQP